MDLDCSPCVADGVRFKASEALRFLGAVAGAVVVLGFVVLRVTSCAPAPEPHTIPAPPPAPPPVSPVGVQPGLQPPGAPVMIPAQCQDGPVDAAAANAASLATLAWAPFRRPEFGWEIYAPLIAREIGSGCPPASPGFAAAFAAWEKGQGMPADGIVDDEAFKRMKGIVETRRAFIRLSVVGVCPDAPAETLLEDGRPDEGYSGKPIQLLPEVFAAYRRMAAAARAEDPRIAADPRNLTIFSGYRNPNADALRCALEGNCNGVVRATCSAHRTGMAVDLYVGQAPGFGPDSSADPNRLYMSRTPTYRWLVANADRFGFQPYPFEPWHWEWSGSK